MTNKQESHEAVEEVTLADEGTPLAQFQKDRTDAMSAMFDRDRMCGQIHTTGKLYADLDNSVRVILSQLTPLAAQKGVEHCSEPDCPECNKAAFEAGRLQGIEEAVAIVDSLVVYNDDGMWAGMETTQIILTALEAIKNKK